MIVTYGQPLNFSSNFQVYPTNFWDNCVEYCYLLSSCVAAYSPYSPINCQIFGANQLISVKKLNSTSEQLVAFKIQTPYTSCQETPSLAYASGISSDSKREYMYFITQDDAEEKWELNYNKCEPDWTLFSRPKGDWCIQTFGGPSITLTQSEAEHLCNSKNATLSGLESQEERSYAMASATILLGSNYPNFSAFWISGVRKPECEEDGWEDISYCNDDIEQFTYSDPYLTTYSGITWDLNQPDRNAAGYWQNCIQIWIRQQYQYPLWNMDEQPNGAADDAPCDEGINEYYAMRGAVCGKIAD